MWFRYKCYENDKYVFSGIIHADNETSASQKVNETYGVKYDVREIEEVE